MGRAIDHSHSRKGHPFWRVSLLGLALLLAFACGGGAKPSEVLAPATPGFANQPAAQTVTLGQTATFSVTATGFAPFTYQWMKDGTPIPAATGASYTTPATGMADDGAQFSVRITNRLGSADSSSASLWVQWAPAISSQPLDKSVVGGQSATFSVIANGKPTPTYQWQRNLTDIPGATGPDYTLNGATLADHGATFRCRISNAAGTTDTRSAILSVQPATSIPSITAFSAAPATLLLGQSATLTWVVTGATSLSIDQNVGSVTGLSSTSVTPTSTGIITYTLTASNSAGPATATTQVSVQALPTYALTVNLGSGVMGAPAASASYTQGTAVAYSYALLPGYQNLQVRVDGVLAGNSGSVTMNGPHTLAVTALRTYTITANAGANGSITPSGTTTVTQGSSQTYAITPNAGYQVASLMVDGTPVAVQPTYTFANVSADHSISATFAPVLTVSLDAGVTGTPTATAVQTPGASVPYSYALLPGFNNLAVTLDGSPAPASGTVTMNGPHTLTATSQVQTFTLAASAGPNGSISPAGTTTLNYGSSQVFTVTADPGYQVANVLVDGASVGALTSYTFTNLSANHTISATFQVRTFTITASSSPHGNIGPSGAVVVNQGSTLTFSLTPNAGYQLTSLLVDGASVGTPVSYTFTNVVADHTIVATFSPILTVTVGLGVTGTPGATSAPALGSTVNYNYALATGYKNLSVLLDGNPVAVSGSFTMNGPHTLAASALIQTFTITASAGTNGSISPTGSTTLNYGGSQTYTMTPDPGYQVADVLVDGISVGAVTSYGFVSLAANHTISVSFSALPQFVLTVIKTSGISGVPLSTLGYTPGTAVHYAYSLQPGYQNLQVKLDGVLVGSTGDVTMDGPHTLDVSAQITTYLITVSPGPNGSISPGTGFVNYNTSPTYTITPDPGYDVANVNVDGANLGAITTYTILAVAETHTISATFTFVGPIIAGRVGHSATLLASGKTLVAGGSSAAPSASSDLTSSLLYDAATQTWSPSGSLSAGRTDHTATRLQDGTVLVAGGVQGSTYLTSAEIFNPTSGSWSPTGSLSLARSGHSATLLADGRVLVVGGHDATGPLPTTELYDPTTRLWSPVSSLATARSNHSATLLADGTVLVAGGLGVTGAILHSERFDPQTGVWSLTAGALAEARASHSATLLADGTVLVAGGTGNAGALSSAERFDPGAGTWALTGALDAPRTGHRATLLPSGMVLVSGGSDGTTALLTVEAYDPIGGTWTLGNRLKAARTGHTATLQPDGSVLLAFGTQGNVAQERYVP
ncbi:kelch repeat-containing protein [Geothrix sp. PMB-07]|uniref:kelch repeat-containing protein n=1 Tax=Geothrix sp. PMB-07 TaxID=3068640 RepID=UPI002740C39C|nr:kelch repeat-containing protein [Geothrix sp. PMB-07]WLT32486.1 kelch repeat-containing protein [Geothrix sp. PMB-07]